MNSTPSQIPTISTRSTNNSARPSAYHSLVFFPSPKPPDPSHTAMLPAALAEEIDRLLRQGDLSQRSIAAQLHVSRGVVSAIARGDRQLFGRELPAKYSPLTPNSPPTRCPRCGYRVYVPCIICRTREHKTRQRILAILAADSARHTQSEPLRFSCDVKRSA